MEIARPPTLVASSVDRSVPRPATTTSATPDAGQGAGHALPHLAGAEHEHPALDQGAEPLGGQGDGGRRQGHRAPADAGLGPGALPDLDGMPEDPGQAVLGGALGLGDLQRIAHLAEDLALPQDTESTPAATPKRWATAASS